MSLSFLHTAHGSERKCARDGQNLLLSPPPQIAGQVSLSPGHIIFFLFFSSVFLVCASISAPLWTVRRTAEKSVHEECGAKRQWKQPSCHILQPILTRIFPHPKVTWISFLPLYHYLCFLFPIFFAHNGLSSLILGPSNVWYVCDSSDSAHLWSHRCIWPFRCALDTWSPRNYRRMP